MNQVDLIRMTYNFANDTSWYGVSTSKALYAQKMTYDHLDIASIEYSGDCYFGRSRYQFGYDYNHRLLSAYHVLYGDNPVVQGYSAAFTYDPAGNIETLLRRGRHDDLTDPNAAQYDLIDRLDYQYTNGQLTGITDAAGATPAGKFGFPLASASYAYDQAGNITHDGVRNMVYNAFNLPSNIDVIEQVDGEDITLALTYLSSGILYRRVGKEDRIYLGPLELKDGAPETLQFGDGRVVFKGNNASFQYKIADHLGNTVVLFEDKNDDGTITENIDDPASSEVLQRTLYYPFGMELRGMAAVRPETAQNYLYNGREQVEGTGLYAYGFRYYDPTTAIFTGVDPIADQFAFVSAVNYAENSPIRYIDLHGLQKAEPNQKDGISAASMRGGAPITTYNSQLRLNYRSATSLLEPLYSPFTQTADHQLGVLMRTEFKEATRAGMIGGRGHLDAADPIHPKFKSDIPGEPNPRFFNTNSGMTRLAKVAQGVGAVGSFFTIFDLTSAYNEVRFQEQLEIELGRTGGAWMGMKTMVPIIAASPDPYTKTPIGATIAVGIGGVVGSIGGEKAVVWMQENIRLEAPKKTGVGYTTCFVAGTKILMADGSTKNIEDVKEGESILNVNVSTMLIEVDTVTLILPIVSTYRKIIMKLSNNEIIEFSPAHPFWVEGKGWSVFDMNEAIRELEFKVQKIEIGDKILRYEQGELRQIEIHELYDSGYHVKMYNLENVARNHSFFANGVLVHNKKL